MQQPSPLSWTRLHVEVGQGKVFLSKEADLDTVCPGLKQGIL